MHSIYENMIFGFIIFVFFSFLKYAVLLIHLVQFFRSSPSLCSFHLFFFDGEMLKNKGTYLIHFASSVPPQVTLQLFLLILSSFLMFPLPCKDPH